MVFSSAVFLFAFLPIVIILHSLIKNNTFRNALLIVASLVFYAWGEPVYVLLLLASIVFNFFVGNGLRKYHSKPLLILSVVVNVGLLIGYKYVPFLCELINVLPFVNLLVPVITMPIGISFYTFQAMSFCFDSFNGKSGKDGDISGYGFFDVMLYICLFPQLVAGPIVKFNSIREKIHGREVKLENLSSGVCTFIIGLSKKMLIANSCAVVADAVFGAELATIGTGQMWLGALFYCLQIYFDFSGYSDMAVGMGRMFGFEFPVNFNYPYVATSIRDFWKRWHISLTSWFREYLYFPMGGNRKGKIRTMFNRFFVFLCTGIWHGANLTFLFWGIYHGILTMIETLLEDRKYTKNANKSLNNNGEEMDSKPLIIKMLSHVYALVAIAIGFVIFRADSISLAFGYIGRMFSVKGLTLNNSAITGTLTPLCIITGIVGIIFSTPVLKFIPEGRAKKYLGYVMTIVLYILCIMEIAAGSYNPFIYFRF